MRSHRCPRNAGRTVATAAVLLCAATLLPTPAQAAGNAKAAAHGGGSVTSGSWLATVSPTVLTFTNNTAQTATVANTGSIALAAIGYRVTISSGSGSPTFTLFACAVPWSGGTCSGGTGTRVGTSYSKNSTILVSSSLVPPLGGSVYLQATPTSVISSITMTLGTSISSAQLRAPIKTNQ